MARRHLGLDDNARVAVVVGSLSAEKRVDRAIHAIGLVPDAHLLIAGDGPRADELRLLAGVVLGDRVHFLGSVDDVRPVFDAADLLLLTSATEGMPGSVIEASMCGVPTVSTDVGAIHDLVLDGISGRIVAAETAAIADGVREVLDRRGTMSTHAVEHSCRHFSAAVVVPMWSTLLAGSA